MNKKDQEFIIQEIRSQYVKRDHTEFDELKTLDNDVKRPANVFAYVFGSIGAIVMGSGMSLIMTDIAQTLGIQQHMVIGVIVGVIGMVMAIMNYPIYKTILNHRKKKYSEKILFLSNKLLNKE